MLLVASGIGSHLNSEFQRETHPVFNIGPDVVFNAFKYFSSQQKIQELDKLD